MPSVPDSVPDLGALRFRRPRDVGGALNATFVFVRQNARELATSYLALVLPVLLAGAVASALWMASAGDALFDPSPEDPFAIFNWAYGGSLLFGFLGGALMQAAAAGYVRLYREGEAGTVTAGRLWEESRGLVLPYIGMTLLFGAAAVLSAVINIVPCLGSIAWVALLVWLFPYYAVAVAARGLEAESVGDAWRRARVLVKGSWGFAFGALALAFSAVFVLYFGLGMVAGVGAAVAGAGTADGGASLGWTGLLMAPVQVVGAAVYLVPLVAAFFVHGRLTEEVDGSALGDDLDALASGLDAPSDPAPVSTVPASTPPPVAERDAEGPAETRDAADRPSGGFRGGGFG